MGRVKVQPYECISCGYATRSKYDMRKHFYERKQHCNRTKNKITLTEEIKLYILENRCYDIPKPTESNTVVNQVINTYNCWNNFISKMPLQDKVNVIYDNVTKKIKMFQDGVWDDHLTHIGVNKLFEAL